MSIQKLNSKEFVYLSHDEMGISKVNGTRPMEVAPFDHEVAGALAGVCCQEHIKLGPYPADLTVTRKAISITDSDFAVTDINGNIVFQVKGKVLISGPPRLQAGIPLFLCSKKASFILILKGILNYVQFC